MFPSHDPAVCFSNELREIDYFSRVASRVLGIPVLDIPNQPDEFSRRIKDSIFSKVKLRIKYHSPGAASVSSLRSYLSHLQVGEGFTPDLVVVDYPDRMRLSGGGDKWERIGQTYRDLIRMADDFGHVVWTPSQIGRAGYEIAEPSANLVRGSIEKIEDADHILIQCQTRS